MTIGAGWSRANHDEWETEHEPDQDWGLGWALLVLSLGAVVMPFLVVWLALALAGQSLRAGWRRVRP